MSFCSAYLWSLPQASWYLCLILSLSIALSHLELSAWSLSCYSLSCCVSLPKRVSGDGAKSHLPQACSGMLHKLSPYTCWLCSLAQSGDLVGNDNAMPHDIKSCLSVPCWLLNSYRTMALFLFCLFCVTATSKLTLKKMVGP